MMKKYNLLTLLLLLSFAVYAESPATEKQAQRGKDLLNSVKTDLQAVKADFVQYELLQSGEKKDFNSGLVWLQSPNQFRWEYRKPIQQLIVADGKMVWVYDEDLEQVTIKEQDNKLNPIYVIINQELSERHYQIRFEKQQDELQWISLTPKQNSEEVKQVWLAIKDKNVEQIKVINPFEQVMVFEFSNIKRNPSVKKKLFSFKPPKDVDIIYSGDKQQ